MEVENNQLDNEVQITLEEFDAPEQSMIFCLSDEDLYNLIGALHSIQTKRKGGQNG